MLLRPFYLFVLWLFGWKARERLPKEIKKSIILVVPHTSNWDFLMGICLRSGLRLQTNFLGKKALFRAPWGFLFRWLGGSPVDRNRKSNTVDQVADIFAGKEHFNLSIAPEGTRSLTKTWKSGFYHIAMKANLPICLAYIDFGKKEGGIGKVIDPCGDYEKDLATIQKFYRDKLPLYPEKSSLEHIPGKTSVCRPLPTALRLLLLAAIVWAAVNFPLLAYGTRQAYGQADILYRAVPRPPCSPTRAIRKEKSKNSAHCRNQGLFRGLSWPRPFRQLRAYL